jgi:hypothetical protein
MFGDHEGFMTDGSYFDELIPSLKNRAKVLIQGTGSNNMNELITRITFLLAQHYRIPAKSPIFSTYDPEELFLEYFMIQEYEESLRPKTEQDKQKDTVEAIKENLTEAKGLFDDFRPRSENLFSSEEAEEFSMSFNE